MAQQESEQQARISNGPAAAAILASGVGSVALGAFTVAAEASTGLKNALSFYDPSGPLSGKTTLAVAVWLVAWLALHLMWRKKDVDLTRTFWVTGALIALGVIGTFPPFFELFAGG